MTCGPPSELRAAQAADARGDARRRRRHLPGDLLRRPLARPCRLPVQASDRPSPTLGDWSYDIADTKLARSVKGGAILQMCVYADLLERTPGHRPGVALRHHRRPRPSIAIARTTSRPTSDGSEGGSTPACTRRTAGGPAGTYPDPGRPLPRLQLVPDVHRSSARRRPSVDRGRDAARGHRAALTAAGVPTLAGLAVLEPDRRDRRRSRAHSSTRIREQARLQLQKRDDRRATSSSSSNRRSEPTPAAA